MFVVLTVSRRVLCRAGGTPRTARWSPCGRRWCPTITCPARRAPWPRPSRAPSERPRSTSATAPTGTDRPARGSATETAGLDGQQGHPHLPLRGNPPVTLWTGNLGGLLRMSTNRTRIGDHVNVTHLMPCSPQFQCCRLEYLRNY